MMSDIENALMIARLQARADFDEMRTGTIRLLMRQVDLLTDSRTALSEGLTDVTDEFIERVVQMLSEHITHLRSL